MACDQLNLAVPGVQQLHPYQPGKPIEELERELGIKNSVKLASNENPLGISAVARDAAQKALADSALYPDAMGFHLKQRLTEVYGIPADQLTLGNGSNDLLELIARVFVAPGDQVIYSEYAFIVYPLVTQACSAEGVEVPARDFGHDLDAMAGAVTQRTRLIYLANPNNPTGTVFSQSEFELFMAQIPESVLVVLDEAYTEYLSSDEIPNGLQLVGRYPNLIVTRTFSKAWGLAGLRVGFAAASAQVTDLLNRVRQPFNVNSVALAAAEAVLGDGDYLAQSVALNRSGMQQLETGLRNLNIEFIPSQGNFLTIDLGRPALPVYQALLQEGVIVRPLGIYRMPNHLRISIGTETENRRFLEALARVNNV